MNEQTAHDRVEVVEIAGTDAHALRREVLRSGDPAAVVAFDEDGLPGVVHLGLRRGGRLVAVSTWIPRPFPEALGAQGAGAEIDPVQLRGMATGDGLRGTGLGGVLLEAGCARTAAGGATIVWAKARDAALGFYERHGFAVHGEGFVDATTQLPHHLVVRRLI